MPLSFTPSILGRLLTASLTRGESVVLLLLLSTSAAPSQLFILPAR